ncbi:MAG TPA: acyl-CoA dehydrogenase family protein, partial [Sphingomonas sp.]|nr:acyl-CoA dehydrogenase family protein [Sphingomonas sp.]
MFTPATAEQRFVLDHVVRLAEIGGEAADMADAVLDGAGQFAAGEWAPLDRLGDTEGPKWTEEGVKMPAGFAEAYRAYVEGGWGTIGSPAEFGGQGLPVSLSAAVLETLGTANMGFALAPILTVGAIEALTHHGTPEQQAIYLPKLATGEWTGTMNLTEPQAGSDVGALKSRAEPTGDGKWKIKG